MPSGLMVARIGIEGRVQGVGYREWTRRHATELGLVGWVRNRRDGSVEALFCGEPAAVETMIARCGTGPRAAAVTRVTRLPWDGPRPSGGFDVIATI